MPCKSTHKRNAWERELQGPVRVTPDDITWLKKNLQEGQVSGMIKKTRFLPGIPETKILELV